MKALHRIFVFGLAAVSILSAGAEENEAAKKDMAQLQGEWSMVAGTADGQPIPEGIRKQMKRVCKGDEATTTMGAQVMLKARITVDPAKEPKAIDYKMTGGVNTGKTQLGIYELDRDTFRSCFSAPGDPRPTDFVSKPGDHRTSTVWKREQAATQPDQK